MKFESIELDPAKNPAVLDTATWDAPHAWSSISSVDESYWKSVTMAVRRDCRPPEGRRLTVYSGAAAEYRDGSFLLVELDDGQQVFVELAAERTDPVLVEPIGTKRFKDNSWLAPLLYSYTSPG